MQVKAPVQRHPRLVLPLATVVEQTSPRLVLPLVQTADTPVVEQQPQTILILEQAQTRLIIPLALTPETPVNYGLTPDRLTTDRPLCRECVGNADQLKRLVYALGVRVLKA